MNRLTDWLVTGERPALPLYVSPFAKSASGGNDDDDPDEDDPDEDDEPDDDDPDEDDEDEGKSDEELRAELKAIRGQLTKANGSSAKRRRRVRELEAELASERRKPNKSGGGKPKDAEVDPDLIREEARREGETAGLQRAKVAEAKSSLLAAGVNPERVKKAVGLIDLGDLDLDDDGLDGIDDEIDKLKKEWPELFERKPGRRRSVAGQGDRGGDRGRKKELTPSQRQAALVTGRG